MRWGHATRLPKPPYADSRRHSGVNASILARAPRGNRPPEWSTILAQGLLRPARRSQSCLHTPIRTPVSLHRNLLPKCCDDRLNPPFARRSSAQGAGLADPRRAIGTPPRLYQLQSRSHRARCSDRMAVVWLFVTGLAATSRSRRLGGLRRRPEGARVQPVGVKVEHAAVKFAGVARLTAEKVEIFYVLPSFGDDPRLVVGAGRFVAGNNCRRPQGRDLV